MVRFAAFNELLLMINLLHGYARRGDKKQDEDEGQKDSTQGIFFHGLDWLEQLNFCSKITLFRCLSNFFNSH